MDYPIENVPVFVDPPTPVVVSRTTTTYRSRVNHDSWNRSRMYIFILGIVLSSIATIELILIYIQMSLHALNPASHESPHAFTVITLTFFLPSLAYVFSANVSYLKYLKLGRRRLPYTIMVVSIVHSIFLAVILLIVIIYELSTCREAVCGNTFEILAYINIFVNVLVIIVNPLIVVLNARSMMGLLKRKSPAVINEQIVMPIDSGAPGLSDDKLV